MCGIAGFAATEDTDTESVVGRMMGTLARRGPDGAGIASWPGATFGHRRLAVLDLTERASQPMLSADRRIGLVFNGCIYNFIEIRADLQRLGCRFESDGDTEVLLHGYAEWGIDALVSRLRGMFAFAIWDRDLRKLILVRDRLGVKPLVYSVSGRGIAFASTVSALEAAGFAGAVNSGAVMSFLEFGYVTDDRAIFDRIAKVPPATIMEWQDGRISSRLYWSLPPMNENSRVMFEEAVEETERLLLDAVKVRLRSDVPVGALLSGGVDSALVCWAMRQLNADIKTFTFSTPGDSSDESAAALETASLLGIPLRTVAIETAGDNTLDELVHAYSEPYACQSASGMLNICRAVKPVATVLLTGDGGDDIFLGYPYFHNAWKAQKLAAWLPPGSHSLWRAIRPLAGMLPGSTRGKHFLDYATGGLGPYRRVRQGIRFFRSRNLLGDRLAAATLAEREGQPSLKSARSLLPELLDYHKRTESLSEFMPKLDGTSMYFGIEARSPLLDHRIWEFAATLSPEVRFHGGRLKSVLREIVRRRIGSRVAFRKKQGFTIPVEKWLVREWRESFRTFESRTLLEDQGWVTPGCPRKLVTEALAAGSAPVQLWYLLVLEMWLRKQARNVPAGTHAGAALRCGPGL
jgi:asparagine synthase (glutamine-hydrolysing)